MISKINTTYGSRKRRFVAQKGTLSSKGEHFNIFEEDKDVFFRTDDTSPVDMHKQNASTEMIRTSNAEASEFDETEMENLKSSGTEERVLSNYLQCVRFEKKECLNQKDWYLNKNRSLAISPDTESENSEILKSEVSSELYLKAKPESFNDTLQIRKETRVTEQEKEQNREMTLSQKSIILNEEKPQQSTEKVKEKQNSEKPKKFQTLVSESEKEAWFLFSDKINEKAEKTSQVLRNSLNISLTEDINSKLDSEVESFSDSMSSEDEQTKPLHIANTEERFSDENIDSDLTVCDDPESFENNLISSQILQGFSNNFVLQENDVFSVVSDYTKFEKPKKEHNIKYSVTKTYGSYRSYLTSEMVICENVSDNEHKVASDSVNHWHTKGLIGSSSKLWNHRKHSKNTHIFDNIFDDLAKANTINAARSALIDLCFKLVKDSIEENAALLELHISCNSSISHQIENLINSKDPLIVFCLLSITYFLLSVKKINIVKWLFGDKFSVIKPLIIQGILHTTKGIIEIMNDNKFKISRILKSLLRELLETIFSKLSHFYPEIEQFLQDINSLFFIFSITTGFERLTNYDPVYSSEDINELLILIYDENIVLGLLRSCSMLISRFPTEYQNFTTLDINYTFLISEAFLDLSIVETAEQIAQISNVFNKSRKEMKDIYSFAINFDEILQQKCLIIEEDISKNGQLNILIDSCINFLQSLILILSMDNIERFKVYVSNIDEQLISEQRLYSILSFLNYIVEKERKLTGTVLTKLRISLLGFLFQISTHNSLRHKFFYEANLRLLKKLFLSLEISQIEHSVINSRAYIGMLIGKLLNDVEAENLLLQVFSQTHFKKMLSELKTLRSSLLQETSDRQFSIIIDHLEPILDVLSKNAITN